jgi:hypothetical protein
MPAAETRDVLDRVVCRIAVAVMAISRLFLASISLALAERVEATRFGVAAAISQRASFRPPIPPFLGKAVRLDVRSPAVGLAPRRETWKRRNRLRAA